VSIHKRTRQSVLSLQPALMSQAIVGRSAINGRRISKNISVQHVDLNPASYDTKPPPLAAGHFVNLAV